MSTTKSKTEQYVQKSVWYKPSGKNTGVFVQNSYPTSDKKCELIIPSTNPSNTLSWYTCGPTVYDKSHLGHARTYIGFDIIRRIMEDYFQMNILYIVNVTDIDDKIIKKANKVLLEELIQFIESKKSKIDSKLVEKYLKSPDSIFQKIVKENEKDTKSKSKEQQVPSKTMFSYIEQLQNEVIIKQLNLLKDFSEFEKLELKSPNFQKVSRKFEKLFWDDMKDLNVRKPSVIVRVTEHVPEVINFVDKIMKNGYAYESNGSVYFDTQSFVSSKPKDCKDNHVYGKLEPTSVGNMELQLEGEGEWGASNQKKVGEKKHPNDFALWKKSDEKHGEPSWKTTWGSFGRPGWHIECSAMASHIVQKPVLDIHAGGEDLKFPHHDNEIAQSEAFFNSKQWCNYFVHAGHLKIDGRTMSKSKKNFITIQEALQKYNANQIRMLFLLHKVTSTMDFSPSTMDTAVQKERMFNEFFHNVKNIIRKNNENENKGNYMNQRWNLSENQNQKESELFKKFISVKDGTKKALMDCFNTPLVINLFTELVSMTNNYIHNNPTPKTSLLFEISNFITKMFKIFGLINDQIGFSVGGGDNKYEQSVKPFIDLICDFRETIRKISREKNSDKKEILKQCDMIRDEKLCMLGVRLEDIEGKSKWKLENKETLIKEMKRKKEEMEKLLKQKAEQKRLAALKEKEKWEKAKIDPLKMFLNDKRFSAFGEDGLPTHLILKDGETETQKIPKSLFKKLKKEQNKQSKLHKQYLKKFPQN